MLKKCTTSINIFTKFFYSKRVQSCAKKLSIVKMSFRVWLFSSQVSKPIYLIKTSDSIPYNMKCISYFFNNNKPDGLILLDAPPPPNNSYYYFHRLIKQEMLVEYS